MANDPHRRPTVLVIFGGRGDLTCRKLIPALFNLHLDKSLPQPFALHGLDRVEVSTELLRERLRDGVNRFSRRGPPAAADWDNFVPAATYQQADFDDPAAYSQLSDYLAQIDARWNARANRVFYLATPPTQFGVIARHLGEAGLSRDPEHSHIVVEKPLGCDLESARQLNRVLTDNFHEPQIFRIDHYLGKETVQNILAFRFANVLFELVKFRGRRRRGRQGRQRRARRRRYLGQQRRGLSARAVARVARRRLDQRLPPKRRLDGAADQPAGARHERTGVGPGHLAGQRRGHDAVSPGLGLFGHQERQRQHGRQPCQGLGRPLSRRERARVRANDGSTKSTKDTKGRSS